MAGAAVLAVAVAGYALHSVVQFERHARDIVYAYEVGEAVGSLRVVLKEIESARRGYALTGDPIFEEEFHAGLVMATVELERTAALLAGNPAHAERFAKLEPLYIERTQQLRDAMLRVKDAPTDASTHRAATLEGATISRQLHQGLVAIRRAELEELDERRQRANRQGMITVSAIVAGGVLSLGGFILSVVGLNRAAGRLARAEKKARTAFDQQTQWVHSLERRNADISALGEIGGLLQACNSETESLGAFAESMERLFPGTSGTVCLLRPSRDRVYRGAVWGADPPSQDDFAPGDCWALRTLQPHHTLSHTTTLACRHLTRPLHDDYICMPMMAHGESLGVLVLNGPGAPWADPSRQRVAEALARDLGQALANLALRERLMVQSITDALTGVYNRRYMEESLARALSQARRTGRPVGVLLGDVDHFKKFNDTYGHQAGDAVLKAVGEFLRNNIREGDIVARYGGEEFALIMPDATQVGVVARAEALRRDLKAIRVRSQGETLPGITLSIGVALYPDHGASGHELLAAADKALYRAKQGGRDRVETAVAEPASADASETP